MSEPLESPNPPAPTEKAHRASRRARGEHTPTGPERGKLAFLWYRFAQHMLATLFAALGTWRTIGPAQRSGHGGGSSCRQPPQLPRPLSARNPPSEATQFRRPINPVPPGDRIPAPLARRISDPARGHECLGAQGDPPPVAQWRHRHPVPRRHAQPRRPARAAQVGHRRPGLAAGVPVVPAGIAGTYEAWPRSQRLPSFKPMRIHYGPPIQPGEIAGMDSQAITDLIRDRIKESIKLAQEGLARDLNH